MIVPIGDFNPYSKEMQLYDKPVKLSQKQMGDISHSVDRQLKERSDGKCEIREKCSGARAVVRCHTTGRRIIPRKTTVDDLFHGCAACHVWFDETVEGIRFKRRVRRIGTTTYLKSRSKAL